MMEKRSMEKLGAEVSLLGFGCMRFPMDAQGNIEEKEAEAMLDTAIKSGVNYIDTAYRYHNGDSEPFVGRVLNKYPRDSYYLATKLPIWMVNSPEDVDRIFEEQLQRLDKEYVDFYLVHALDKERFEAMKKFGVLERLEQKRAEGKFRYLGFSFHDEEKVFEEILSYYNWDFCQIQFNYMDTDIQAGLKGYEFAKEKGVPMVIMEPIKGGMLASLPSDVEAAFRKERPGSSMASWALRFVGSFSNVKVILSGMSSMEQVKDNLGIFSDFQPLSEEEKELVDQCARNLKAKVKNGCTGCSYCMPCPSGVNIPLNFKIWNEYAIYQNQERTKERLNTELKKEEMADVCVRCGKCEQVCPQKLPIREHLKQAAEDFGKLLGKCEGGKA